MANDRRTELTIALIDQVSSPASRVSRAVAEVSREMGRAERGTSRSSARFAAGLESAMTRAGSSVGPAGRAGGALVAGHERTAAALSRSAVSHAAVVDRAYSGIGLSAAAAARAIAPLAAALGAGNSIRVAADFESSLTELQKKSGATSEEIARVGEEIKALSTSGRVASSIEDIAAAYSRGAAAGIPLAELREFAELSVKGSDAFAMTAEEVGNFSAKLKAGLGMSDAEVRRVFDLTNSLADAGIADEKDIVAFQDRVGATTKVLGLSTEQGLALGATLLNLGFQAEVAATGTGALSGKLLTVSTLSGKAKKSFERVMGPTERFAKLVNEDANAALLQMLDTLKELPKSARMDFLKNFVGAEWSDEVIRLVEGVDELRRNLKLAGDETAWLGSLDKSYALKLDDFWSQWAIVKNAVEKLAINIATPTMPALVAGLEKAVALTEAIDAGMGQLRLRIDWSAIDDAKTAVGELADEVGRAIGVDTSGSTVNEFFRDLAGLVNELAGVVGTVSRELKDVAAFARDPIGELTRERSAEELAKHGIRKIGPEERERRGREYRERQEREAADGRERSLDDFVRGDGRVTAPPEVPADRGGRVVQPDAARFAPAALPGEAHVAELAASIKSLSTALAARAGAAPTASGDLGKSTGAIAVPTVRPDIMGPLLVETAAAKAEASRAGQIMADALSVTAAPVVQTGSIMAALGAVNRLAGAMRALPSSIALGGPSMALGSDVRSGPMPRRAGGGAVRGGPYLVGERGPEVVHMGRNGYVTPNHRLGDVGGTTISPTFYVTGSNGDEIVKKVMDHMNRLTGRSRQVGLNR